ncbi:MAG: LptF/LptG family permease [Treponema sp.]|nr:LptF/LptG family permease [Treponema sp.]
MTLEKYLLKHFFPVLIVSLLMFMMLALLIDLFLNLVKYLNNGAAIGAILKTSLFFLPKSFTYALPASLLFSASYTIGYLYAGNELVMVTGSGIPFWRFCLPLIAAGILSSFFAFFFEDNVVVPTLRIKNRMSSTLLGRINEENQSDVVIKAEGGKLIYVVDYFDPDSWNLNGLTIIELNEDKTFASMVRSPQAVWKNDRWNLSNPLRYAYQDGFLRPQVIFDPDQYNETPDTFKRSAVVSSDLKAREVRLLVADLKRAGLPYVSALADYHHRFSFSAVSFVVIFLSLTMGGRFKKNILLMSLLASLGTAVIYYVIEMISMMSARVGLLPPLFGAWIPVVFCTAAGLLLLAKSKT